MSDEFLRAFVERPDPEFAESLYQRISANRGAWPLKRLVWVPAVLSLLIVSAFITSPVLRAGALSVIRSIGRVEVEETEFYPGTTGQVFRSETVHYTLAEAQEIVPFEIKVPTWAPAGFELAPDVAVIAATDRRPVTSVFLTWHNRRRTIMLTVEQSPDVQPPHRLVAGLGSVEEVVVNGEPAALVRGAWHADEGTYDTTRGVVLVWVTHDLVHSLRSSDARVSAQELVRMAESVR